MKTTIIPRIARGFSRIVIKILPLCILLALGSCEEPEEIGLDLVDDENKIDILPSEVGLKAYTQPGDSVPTNFGSRNILGYHNHPVFGSTRASIHAEFNLGYDSVKFGNNPILDSVVLELYYSGRGIYGDSTSTQNIKIYELDEHFPELEEDKYLYYSTLVLDHDTEQSIYNSQVTPYPTKEIEVGGDTIIPHLRLKLSESFGYKLLEGPDKNYGYVDNEGFSEYMKGLYLTATDLPETEEGGLLYFDFTDEDVQSSLSRIVVHYHDISEDGDIIPNQSHSFPVHLNNRNTHPEFSYTNANRALRNQIIDEDITNGDSLLFIQSLGGTDVVLEFSNKLIDSLYDINAIINHAKLTIPVDESLNHEEYPLPGRLLIMAKTHEGIYERIREESHGYYGGFYDDDKKQYEITITQHLQELVDNPGSNRSHKLLYTDAHSMANSVVINGPKHPERQIQLNINFTTFD